MKTDRNVISTKAYGIWCQKRISKHGHTFLN